MAELEKRARVVGIEFGRPLQVLDGGGPLALREVATGKLKVVFGTVGGDLRELCKDRPRLGQVPFLSVNPGALQLHLAGSVAGFLRPLEGLERFVELLLRSLCPAEVEAGQRALG